MKNNSCDEYQSLFININFPSRISTSMGANMRNSQESLVPSSTSIHNMLSISVCLQPLPTTITRMKIIIERMATANQ